ncbi:hypothetical protein ACFL5X_03200 [Candidatus Omnitrophota bacterium]
MKRTIALILLVAFLFTSLGTMAFAGDGPAPDSHDGTPDGSGLDDKGQTNDDKGAPDSGDGVPDCDGD